MGTRSRRVKFRGCVPFAARPGLGVLLTALRRRPPVRGGRRSWPFLVSNVAGFKVGAGAKNRPPHFGQRNDGRRISHSAARSYIVAWTSPQLSLGLPLADEPLNQDQLHHPDTADNLNQVPVERIMSGTEPSLAEKRLAKKAAWANGSAPEETVHRIFEGDARRMEAIQGEEVHLVVTSPPYFDLVAYENGTGSPAQLGSSKAYEEFLDELDKVWTRAYDMLTPGGRMCVVVGDVLRSRKAAGRHHMLPLHADIGVRCRRLGFDYLNPIFWYKIANAATEVAGSGRFLGKPYEPNAVIKNDVEYILLLRKPGAYRKPSSVQRALSLLEPEEHQRWFRAVWDDVRGENRRRGHPAPYPVEIARRLIRMFSFVGDTVLDPFWGTGTTTVAAIETGRSSVGFEIEPRYIEMGQKRLAQTDVSVIHPKIIFGKDLSR